MCPLNHVGVPIFCPTTRHTTTAEKLACLFCYFRVQICANSGLPVLLETVLLFQEMPKNGLRPLPENFNLFGICISVCCLERPRICNILPFFVSVFTADITVKERQTKWISGTTIRPYTRPWTSGIHHSSLAF